NEVFREDIGKRQVAVLKKLTPQKTDLLAKPSLVRMTHRLASLPQMGLLGKTIFGSEAFFAYVILAKRLAAKLRAIRRWDRSRLSGEDCFSACPTFPHRTERILSPLHRQNGADLRFNPCPRNQVHHALHV